MSQGVPDDVRHVFVTEHISGLPALPDSVDHSGVPEDAQLLRHMGLGKASQRDELVHGVEMRERSRQRRRRDRRRRGASKAARPFHARREPMRARPPAPSQEQRRPSAEADGVANRQGIRKPELERHAGRQH